jgi:hypothetical protein
MMFVLSVVSDVPVDSETPVVTSSILRICRLSLRRCSWGRVCTCVHRDKCACVVSVSDVMCKKTLFQLVMQDTS